MSEIIMTHKELQRFLLERFPKENESCEWKPYQKIKEYFSAKEGNDVVSYVSAISNMEGGHLVIGVEDQTLDIIGIDNYNYPADKVRLRLTDQCANLPSEGLSLDEYRTSDTNKLVWVLTIPKHSKRLPVYAHSKAWQRIDDSLVPITRNRLDSILSEIDEVHDWSSEIIESATIEDLDTEAISLARKKYIELHPEREQEILSWDIATFLNKAKITRQGRITKAAIIILGKSESEHFLTPSICRIRWVLKSKDEIENKDFKIFTIPMILAIEELSSKIRNTTYTYTIQGNIFPESMMRYDVFTLREPLNNAIAHQDYSKQAYIEVVEYEDEKLLFRNHAHFIPESVESVVSNDFPDSQYRNPFLVEAMRNVKMVETEGGGIKKLFVQQKRRFFPMPQYDLSDDKVVCVIEGKVLDENFAKILVNNPTLTLMDIMLLDRVQKHLPINDYQLERLRKKKFVEGRKHNIYLSSNLVKESRHVGLKTSYIKNRSFDDEYFKKLIVEYIVEFGSASRKEVDRLLTSKLPDTLTDRQKFDKITNLLARLRKDNLIHVNKARRWVQGSAPDLQEK